MSWLRITDQLTGKSVEFKDDDRIEKLQREAEKRDVFYPNGPRGSLFGRAWAIDQMSYDEIENLIFDLRQALKKRKRDAKK